MLAPRESTPRQRIGTVLESAIAQLFHERTGLHVAGEQTWVTHRRLDWARCTVDGFVTESAGSSIDDALGVLEIKTDARFGWPDGVPVDIRSQVIWQLACTGLPQAWVAVLHGGFAFEVYEVAWDADAEADWALLRDAGERFWTDNVLAGVPPAVDGSDATRDALIAVYGDHEPGVDVSLDHLAGELVERANLKRLKGEAEERLKLLDNTIREAIGDANFGTLDGERVLKLTTVDVKTYTVAARTDHRLVAATKSDRKRVAA